MKTTPSSHPHLVEALIHIIGWGIVFAFPFIMMSRSGSPITWQEYFRHGSILPVSFFIVFYANYCYLISHYLFKGYTRRFLLLNILLVSCVTIGVHFWQEFATETVVKISDAPRPMGPPRGMMLLRDNFTMILTIGLSVAIRLSSRWVQIETERREAEKSRTEAELKNLRNQLSPHFLLNTLNNIYALIAFDSEKAQATVQELSRLLRHVLYDNQQNIVRLDKEIDFIRNYIELMRIRLSANVTVETRFDIRHTEQILIAPLIFISLIENAFKHGISPTEPSYIHIHFYGDAQEIHCEIRNSYHPKNDTDKSGSGIGLEQVRKRLELTYSGNYQWEQRLSEDKKEYQSILVIKL